MSLQDLATPVVERSATAGQNTQPTLADLLGEPPPRAWYLRKRLWVGLLLVAATGGALYEWQARQTAQAAPSYVTQPASRGDLSLRVTANGTVQPTRSISIGSELSGTVLKVNADVNDPIRRGQVLVELDTAKLRDQILRAQAALESARSALVQKQATVQETRASLARLEQVAQLSGGQVPSHAELDAGRAALARAQADEASARAGVADAQAALSSEQINLAKASIRAPTDGVILTRNVDPGNAVAASLQAVTLFTVAEDLAQVRLQVYVDEADVGSVSTGQQATFTVSAYPGRQYPASVSRVAYGSTITDNVVTYLTYLTVDNRDLSLRPGMTATATIVAQQRHDVLLVPNSALRFTPAASGAGSPGTSAATAASGSLLSRLTPRMPGPPQRQRSGGSAGPVGGARQVWVLRDGAPVAVPVVAGLSDGRMTEIVGGELEPGMAVITDQKSAPSR